MHTLSGACTALAVLCLLSRRLRKRCTPLLMLAGVCVCVTLASWRVVDVSRLLERSSVGVLNYCVAVFWYWQSYQAAR
jgi:predicted membrane protein